MIQYQNPILFSYHSDYFESHTGCLSRRCVWTKWSSPSRDKASKMLRQAVARSAMDCHSSSVESVVSDRTEKQRQTSAAEREYRHQEPRRSNPLCRSIRCCQETKQGQSLGCFQGVVQPNSHWGALLFQGCTIRGCAC